MKYIEKTQYKFFYTQNLVLTKLTPIYTHSHIVTYINNIIDFVYYN